jgi:hypothetical protein
MRAGNVDDVPLLAVLHEPGNGVRGSVWMLSGRSIRERLISIHFDPSIAAGDRSRSRCERTTA